jgi:hypothetical protein
MEAEVPVDAPVDVTAVQLVNMKLKYKMLMLMMQ